MTILEIHRQYNIPRPTILQWLKDADVYVCKKKVSEFGRLSYEEVLELAKQYNPNQIAKKFGLNATTVRERLDNLNIHIVHTRVPHNKIKCPNLIRLQELICKNISDSAIGREFGVTSHTVARWIKEEIKYRALFVSEIKERNEYLTEETLGIFLHQNFNEPFLHNKTVEGSNNIKRPDYHCPKLKLIIEYDGHLHYTDAIRIVDDRLKDEVYTQLGYKIIRIPYFVQLSKDVIKELFGIDRPDFNTYPQGFVSDNVILPADYCSLGQKKFIQDIERFAFIKKDILSSLKEKISELGHKEKVIPDTLENIFV